MLIYLYLVSFAFLFMYYAADEALTCTGIGSALIKAARLHLLLFGIYYFFEYVV